jgi:hypothetical protein
MRRDGQLPIRLHAQALLLDPALQLRQNIGSESGQSFIEVAQSDPLDSKAARDSGRHIAGSVVEHALVIFVAAGRARRA